MGVSARRLGRTANPRTAPLSLNTPVPTQRLSILDAMRYMPWSMVYIQPDRVAPYTTGQYPRDFYAPWDRLFNRAVTKPLHSTSSLRFKRQRNHTGKMSRTPSQRKSFGRCSCLVRHQGICSGHKPGLTRGASPDALIRHVFWLQHFLGFQYSSFIPPLLTARSQNTVTQGLLPLLQPAGTQPASQWPYLWNCRSFVFLSFSESGQQKKSVGQRRQIPAWTNMIILIFTGK